MHDHDTLYDTYSYTLSELAHSYGSNVHLLSDPLLLTELARLSRPETVQPDISYLVRDLYQSFVRTVIAHTMPRTLTTLRTRMFNATKNGVWSGSVIDPTTKVITVDIARAGTLPSQVVFETLVRVINPDLVRQDHIYMNRVTDAQGTVTGVSVAGSKIGGPANNAIVLIPDPMGATGQSVSRAIAMYKSMPEGPPQKIITMHLIVTPEYLQALRAHHPDVHIYAMRLDRGMSEDSVLNTPPGSHWPQERWLNEHQYIVPGAGGLGEILNNSYV